MGPTELTAMHLPGEHAFMIVSVDPGTIAENAGLKRADVIASIGGKPIASLDDLRSALSANSGKLTAISIWRAGQALDVSATLP